MKDAATLEQVLTAMITLQPKTISSAKSMLGKEEFPDIPQGQKGSSYPETQSVIMAPLKSGGLWGSGDKQSPGQLLACSGSMRPQTQPVGISPVPEYIIGSIYRVVGTSSTFGPWPWVLMVRKTSESL